MTAGSTTPVDDPDLRLSVMAMERAALRAREVARQTKTCVVVVDERGVALTMTPEELDRLDQAAATLPFPSGGSPDNSDGAALGEADSEEPQG